MDNFNFYNPTRIVFGKNTIANIGRELKNSCISKVLLMTGKGSIKSNGVYDAVMSSLKAHGISAVEYWGVRPNPLLSGVNEAAALARKEDVQAVLAVGGGSVIDSAKAVTAAFYNENVWEFFEKQTAVTKALPLFTILTISATGSEMNPGAVITHDEEKKKWAFHGPALFPKVSIIDPEVQMSLPWRQTVAGAIDALSHIMEHYFLGHDEETTIAIDEALMGSIIKATDALQANEKDYAARANLAWAATLALNGLSGTALKGGDWASHMLEHAISALHPHIAHGEGLAVIFPAWIKYTADANPEQYERWAQKIWGVAGIDAAIEKMKARYRQWKAPVSLGELGLSADDIEALADNAALAGSLGKVKKLGRDDFIAIYKLAL